MSKNGFQFKQFLVEEIPDVMKVGTDSILLGSWVSHSTTGNILDIGSGNGLLSLMLAQKNPEAQVDAIDVSIESANASTRNFQHNQWKERMFAYHTSLQGFKPDYQYDLIISNPPYFTNGLLAPKQNRALARHTHTLSYQELLSNTSRLLKQDGFFYTVIPTDSYLHFIDIAKECGLHTSSILRIKSHSQKASHICLICLSKLPSNTSAIEASFCIYGKENGKYSHDFQMLTKDFYL